MQFEPLALNFLTIFTLFSFFIALLTQKIFNNSSILLDKDFLKPQAFHSRAVPRCGGLFCMLSLIVFFILHFIIFKTILLDYLIVSLSLFLIGFIDDIKINISPSLRLVLMILAFIAGIIIFSIQIFSVDIIFLHNWLANEVFSVIFILLCFLFIVNGSNLIDGFNGLLSIHLLIINLILFLINIDNNQLDFLLILAGQISILIIFLLFNFPKAKMFLGDSGSYLLGTLTVVNIIKTNNLNPSISSFFFCILLFYLFFEVFFSFFRKIYLKKSPLKPDANHLHMLSYRKLKALKQIKDCNYINSLIVNFIYLIVISPSIYFMNNGILCRYWFFSLLILYIIFYSRLYSFVKK